jgi:glycosyltransferase involved in cell wall biosynthesis
LGRIAYGKRIDRLIRAMPTVLAAHSDARLLIVGPDYGDVARLRELVRSLRLDDSVRFTGPLDQDDVISVLQHATAFAMTTDFELFGITLIEAMASGCAVVAPDVASVPNVVREGVTGLLYKNDDVDDLARNLNLVLRDEPLRRQLVNAGKTEAATRFNFERNLDALEEIYRTATRL